MNFVRYPSKVQIDDITYGFIISKLKFSQLLISDTLPDKYTPKQKFLIIYAIYPKIARITLYPVEKIDIFKIKIQCNTSNPNIVKEITSCFSKNTFIHTTGLMQKNEKYVIENYMEMNEAWDTLKENIRKIAQFSTVMKSQIEEIPIH